MRSFNADVDCVAAPTVEPDKALAESDGDPNIVGREFGRTYVPHGRTVWSYSHEAHVVVWIVLGLLEHDHVRRSCKVRAFGVVDHQSTYATFVACSGQ